MFFFYAAALIMHADNDFFFPLNGRYPKSKEKNQLYFNTTVEPFMVPSPELVVSSK